MRPDTTCIHGVLALADCKWCESLHALEAERDALRAKVADSHSSEEMEAVRIERDQLRAKVEELEHKLELACDTHMMKRLFGPDSKSCTAEVIEERDALRSECRVLREGLESCIKLFSDDPDDVGVKMLQDLLASAPLSAAEASRVAKLEAVCEAARELKDRYTGNWTRLADVLAALDALPRMGSE